MTTKPYHILLRYGRATGVNTITQSKILLGPFYDRVCYIMAAAGMKEKVSEEVTSSEEKATTVTRLIVKCLENEGVKYVFGIPGEENIHFIDALNGSSIRFILVHHEQAASFMADMVRPRYWQGRCV